MMEDNNLFIKKYNEDNDLNSNEKLDIYDECYFSYLDILKEKEIEINCKREEDCKCVNSLNFTTYYDKCDKCNGKGKLLFNEREVVCNRCNGNKRIIREECPLCKGRGKVIKRGKCFVKLNRGLKDGDTVVVRGKGRQINDVVGDLYITVRIKDKNCFEIRDGNVYDKRMIEFSKEDIVKGISKSVETVRGIVKVKSNGEVSEEEVRLEKEGIDNKDYFVCLHNELVEIKGEDAYKNIIINKDMLGFYLMEEEINSNKELLNVCYYKRIDDNKKYEYIELDDVNEFKVIKIKGKGKSGKNGGDKGDLYLRVFFDDEFKYAFNKLCLYPMRVNNRELNEGKKTIEFNKERISINFDKNLKEEKEIEVKDYGFIINKNKFGSLHVVVNPFEHEVYKVSVRSKDKTFFIKDYKKYFYEEVRSNSKEGLKVSLRKRDDTVVVDSEGNRVIVRIIK